MRSSGRRRSVYRHSDVVGRVAARLEVGAPLETLAISPERDEYDEAETLEGSQTMDHGVGETIPLLLRSASLREGVSVAYRYDDERQLNVIDEPGASPVAVVEVPEALQLLKTQQVAEGEDHAAVRR